MRRFGLLTLVLSGSCVALYSLPRNTVAAASEKERGRALFAEKGCAQCHGTDGIGGGRGPDLQLVRKRKNKEAIARQIRDGGGAMPAYGDVLQQDEIHALVEYLSAKRKHVVTVQPARPEGQAAQGLAGREVPQL